MVLMDHMSHAKDVPPINQKVRRVTTHEIGELSLASQRLMLLQVKHIWFSQQFPINNIQMGSYLHDFREPDHSQELFSESVTGIIESALSWLSMMDVKLNKPCILLVLRGSPGKIYHRLLSRPLCALFEPQPHSPSL